MDPGDKEKTAFKAGNGLYQLTVMPFGLCYASVTFERLMDNVLAEIPSELYMVYLDDNIVYGKTFQMEVDRLWMCYSSSGRPT